MGLALRSNQAFVGDTTNGLVVLDVIGPAAIGFVSNLPEPNTGWVVLNGNIAYTSDATPQSFQVLDITDPALPVLLNVVLTTSSSIRDMAVANGRLFLAMGTDGLLVYDLLNSTMPVLEGQLFAGQDIWRVAAWRSWIVAGDRYAGLYLVDPSTVIYP